MGRRSRKRGEGSVGAPAPGAVPAPAAAPRPAPRTTALRRKARIEERPAAPWGRAPLTELATLAGLVAMVVGFALTSTELLVGGFALVALAAVELSVREHFAGFRSHTTLIAGAVAVAVATPLVALGAPRPVQLAAAAAALVGSWIALRRVFVSKTGGLGFRA